MKQKYIQLEKRIGEELTEVLYYHLPDSITKVTHHFVMPTASRRGLKNVQRLKYAKGLTLLVLHRGEEKSPLYTYVVCNNADNFSRLAGRNAAYEKAIEMLKSTHLDAFETINNALNDQGVVVRDCVLKIANKVVKKLNTPVQIIPKTRIPSSQEVLDILISDGIEVAAVFFKHFNYQPYRNLSLFNVKWSGAVTLVTVVTKTCEVLKGVAICQPHDNFSREVGRSFALQSIVKNTSKNSLNKVLKLNIKELNNFMKEKGFV